MQFSYQDLLTVKDILADVLPTVDDTEMRIYNIGWYNRQVKSGLEKLNYIVPFTETFSDIPIATNLIVPLPSGAWHLKDIFLWNGDECVVESSKRLFHKPFQTEGKGLGYTANKKTGQVDYFAFTPTNDSVQYFYTVNQGNIYLSEACSGYTNIRVVYNGHPKDIDTVKFIPPFCKEALIGYVVERFFFAKKSIDRQSRVDWIDAKTDLYQPLSNTEMSKWDRAVYMMKSVDKKIMNDISEYLSHMNY